MFEPLRGADDGSQRRGASGLGLGLYITAQIAHAHGGTIRVDSNEGQGTRFVVELPRRAPAGDLVFESDVQTAISDEARS